MAMTKAEAINHLKGPNSLSHQESLVKKIAGVQTSVPVRKLIPGGKNLTETITESTLPTAIYNWLRAKRHFTEAVISLCADADNYKNTTRRLVDFDANQKNTEWEVRGKRWLAEQVAALISGDNVLAVTIKRDGLYVTTDTTEEFSPESADWEPYIELTPVRTPTF